MLPVVLFVFYFIVLLFIIYRFTQKRIYDFAFWEVAAIFSIKVFLGCLYGYIFLKYYHGDDTWNFFNDSLPEYHKLTTQPDVFFKDFFPAASFKNAQNFGEGVSFYLRDLEYWTMVKLLAFFNIFSRNNYYIDVLFFNFVTCWGPFLLFKLLLPVAPDKKKVLLICIFFIPSITFWLSGIRGEGLLFIFITILIYYVQQCLMQRKPIYFIWIFFALIGLIIFRVPYLMVLLPALASWIISKKGNRRPVYYFAIVYSICLVLFGASMVISPNKNFSTPVVRQQQSFFLLHGNTRFKLDTLQPTIISFVKVLPQAFANTFVRPFLFEAKGALQWIAAIEVVGFWILLGLFLIKNQKKPSDIFNDPLLLLFLFYGVTQLLIIGYIVPFPGAIVRYKVIPELFLILVMALRVDWRIKLNK